MTYQIFRQYPVHCQITDGIIGSGFAALPNSYETEALARKIAVRLADEEYESCGDDRFVVVPWGTDPRRPPRSRWDELTEEVPF